jgi:hypothetical protein
MYFHLRTLLAVMSLSAIVSAGCAVGVVPGMIAYIVCLSLFMATWRCRLVCEMHDLRPFAWADSWLPWEILLEAVGISLAAFAAFGLSNVVLLNLLLHASSQATAFWEAVAFTAPFGTLAALGVFWLSWPERLNCPPPC